MNDPGRFLSKYIRAEKQSSTLLSLPLLPVFSVSHPNDITAVRQRSWQVRLRQRWR